MNVGERIKKRRTALDMSVDELAEKSNINRSTIYRYESGLTQNMPITNIPILAEALKTTPSYLMGWIDTPEKVRMIPVLGSIACGDPITAEQNIEDYLEEVDANLPSGELFFVKAKGDSMYPTIKPDDYVLIHAQPDVESGAIAAVLFCDTNEVTLKRVKKQDGIIILYPDNNRYEPMVLDGKKPAMIIGEAVRYSGNLKSH